MGYGLDAPLLDAPAAADASAPPMQPGQQQYAAGYPQTFAPPGSQPPPTGLAPYAQQQQQQQQQQQLHYAPAQVPPTAALQPPPVHVVQQHQHIVVVDEPLIVRSRAAAPRFVTCPSCFSSGPTVVKRESGCCTYLAAFALCWVCCPLFWLPCCLDCGKDVVHTCASCKTEVARVGWMGSHLPGHVP